MSDICQINVESPPSAAAQALMAEATVCDMVFVYEPPTGNDWRLFAEYRAAGVDFIQCHPAGDSHNVSEAVQLIAAFHADLRRRDDVRFVRQVDDIAAARREGKLAVGLQLEGFRCLERNLAMVDIYYQLGVRLCHPIFNITNSLGGGCADGNEVGLTRLGREVVREMNRAGMLVDGSHAGYRTQRDMIDQSSAPVVFSHQGADAVHRHIRNIRDDVIDACVARGGVIGITGAGFYLGGPPSVDLLFAHIDHVVQRVGARHVGVGLDYYADRDDLQRFMDAHPNLFPGLDEGAWSPCTFMPPSCLAPLVDRFLAAGYTAQDIHGLLGGNWLRICGEVWK